ncbi:MAG: hypothetical protein IKF90_15330 [Parasporobacterium sp.]|nr:hypothetical protein [Parasporobacterium sp.]
MKLSKRTEELLKEILEHRDNEENCISNYWEERFEKLSMAEDVILRSLFKESTENDMISVMWADNYPYIIFVLANGISFFEEKKMEQVENGESYVNNFYGEIKGLQLQQGTVNSTQNQSMAQIMDISKIDELIDLIQKYDSYLETDYGLENANKVRESINELITMKEQKDTKRANGILNYIRDLSANAGGGLIAAGVLQLINMIVGY